MSPPWMPFYVADYIADTQHLSTAEHGAYMLLIMHYWQKGALPDDDIKLARICRMSEQDFSNAKGLLAEFFEEGTWRHTRIDRELAKSIDKNLKRVEAGRRGGLAKSKQEASNDAGIAPSNASSNALASSSQPQPDKITELRSVRRRSTNDPKSELFDLMKEKFGPKIGSFVGRLLKVSDGPADALASARQAFFERDDADGAKAYLAQIIHDRERSSQASLLTAQAGESWN